VTEDEARDAVRHACAEDAMARLKLAIAEKKERPTEVLESAAVVREAELDIAVVNLAHILMTNAIKEGFLG
jgi:hypothetical protein